MKAEVLKALGDANCNIRNTAAILIGNTYPYIHTYISGLTHIFHIEKKIGKISESLPVGFWSDMLPSLLSVLDLSVAGPYVCMYVCMPCMYVCILCMYVCTVCMPCMYVCMYDVCMYVRIHSIYASMYVCG